MTSWPTTETILGIDLAKYKFVPPASTSADTAILIKPPELITTMSICNDCTTKHAPSPSREHIDSISVRSRTFFGPKQPGPIALGDYCSARGPGQNSPLYWNTQNPRGQCRHRNNAIVCITDNFSSG